MTLAVENLDAGYGAVRVLRGLSLAVDAGEVLCLMGRNGAGKSTTLKAIMGLVRASAGEVRLDATRLDTLARPRRAPPGRRLGAAGPPALRRAHRRREPRDRAPDPPPRRRHPRPRPRPLPAPARTPVPGLRHALGRRAADARHRPRALHQAARPPPRRAHRGPAALDDRAHPRHRRRAQGHRRRHHPRRAARRRRARHRRPHRLRGQRAVAETLPAAGLAPDAPAFRTYVGV